MSAKSTSTLTGSAFAANSNKKVTGTKREHEEETINKGRLTYLRGAKAIGAERTRKILQGTTCKAASGLPKRENKAKLNRPAAKKAKKTHSAEADKVATNEKVSKGKVQLDVPILASSHAKEDAVSLALASETTCYSSLNDSNVDLPEAAASESWHVKLCDFGLIRVLGKGSMGKVILARKKDTSQLYAVKCINRNYIRDEGLRKYVLEEQAILKHISTERDDSDGPTSLHPFVAKMKFSFADSHHLVFVMDVYPGGDLEKLLRQKKHFNAALTRFYAMEIVSALEYLNENGIVHRDLKPANVLLDCDGHAIVTDFGLSKRLTSEAPTSNIPCGSTRYMAPEVIARNEYSFSPDWWALGVMIYEMLTGKPPFPSPPEESSYALMDKICQSEVVIPKKLPVHTKDLITRLLDRDVVTRLSRSDIKQHPYFRQVDWSKVRAKGYPPIHRPKVKNTLDTSQVKYLDKHFVLPNLNVKITKKAHDKITSSNNDQYRGFYHDAVLKDHVSKSRTPSVSV